MKKFIIYALLIHIVFLSNICYANDENSLISRAELAHISMNVHEYVTQSFSIPIIERPIYEDINNSQYASRIIQAHVMGFVNGVGEKQFAPDMKVTNSQAMTVLYRVMQKLNKTYEMTQIGNGNQTVISELNDIPEWAKDAILHMAELNLIDLKDKKFSPNDLIDRTELNNLTDKIKALYVDPNERSEHIDYETWLFNTTGYKLFED